ncbi:hypothetical protein LPW11_21535 [Geomonas sp. RF6]|uniref:hypothetical protein n=1 Tax=Geomonas sp. RF6 TaxID=2897342 RepID=UPI001E59A5C6|nr:hypothetical protein [Geomonas sp. RF6]UFS70438.1 hypothetical protein LPW11_21535 [Geomonas sp. RF6]
METKEPVRRLCSEIQLFDLCSLENCRQKEGRFCTNKEAIEKFEAIQEEDTSSQYLAEEYDEEEDEASDYEADEYEEEEM